MSNASKRREGLRRRPDPLFALLRLNGMAGAGLGLLFVALVLLLDLGHVRSLAFASPDGLLAIALLAAGSIVTFASVAMGGAVMMSGGGDRTDLDRNQPPGAPILLAVRVRKTTR